MFSPDVIKAVASHLNSRFYVSQLKALGVISQLLIRKRNGSTVIHRSELATIANGQIEKDFPLPSMQVVINEREGTVSIDSYLFTIPKEEPTLYWSSSSNAWFAVMADEKGGYQLVASADDYAIPHGEVSIPFDFERYATMPGSVRCGNLILSGGGVIWVIDSWAAIGKVLSSDNWGVMSIPYTRIRNQDVGPTALDLTTKEDMHHTYLNQDTTDELGLENRPLPYTVLEVVEMLVESRKQAVELLDRAVPGETAAQKEINALALRIQKSLGFKELLAEAADVPAKKRTKALSEIIPRHLQNILDAIKENK